MNEPRTAVAHVENRPSADIVPTDANSIMAVIARAASDPSTDVDKLERMMGLYERITDRNAQAAYTAALAEMQPKLPVITERGVISIDKGVTVQSRYAKWEDINDAIKPLLAEHGFALSFRTGLAGDGKITVTGVLSHRGGHQEETTMTLPHDSSGSKNAVQAVGSSTSYGKRYVTQALLNLTSRGEDDDGRAGGDLRNRSAGFQAATAAINSCKTADDLKAWKVTNASALQALPVEESDEVVRLWNQRAAALRGKAPQ